MTVGVGVANLFSLWQKVAAGSVAEKWLRDTYRIEIVAFVRFDFLLLAFFYRPILLFVRKWCLKFPSGVF
jgi:hypothetical protein